MTWAPTSMKSDPLEIMAKARFASRNGNLCFWEDISAREQGVEIKHMRAALLALAEAELPEEVTREGITKAYIEDTSVEGTAATGANNAFRAMLRAIANQPSHTGERE